MTVATTLRYVISSDSKAIIGRGASSVVFKATEEGSGKQVALKSSRVSKTIKRPTLHHETRMLQLLKGHAGIPALYGYGRLEHFEYIAMELLGPSLAELQMKGAGVMVETVVRVVDPVLAALQHIHSLGIVHCDIKPENLVCALEDPSKIKIIDFGICKPFSVGQLSKYDPLEDRRHIFGSLYWASLNSHNGVDLVPRDDIESLALVALFLLRGNLPWKPRPRREPLLCSQEIIIHMKQFCAGPVLGPGFPDAFGQMLTYSRSLNSDQLPDYGALRRSFTSLVGYPLDSNIPLNWTPCYPQNPKIILDEPKVSIPDSAGSGRNLGKDSYYGFDIDTWTRQGERDKDVTLSAQKEAELDRITPLIVEVKDEWLL